MSSKSEEKIQKKIRSEKRKLISKVRRRAKKQKMRLVKDYENTGKQGSGLGVFMNEDQQ